VAVAGGANHSVALDINGNVVVWGSSTPAPPGIRFIAIAARLSYTLALSADGDIYGWGMDPGIFGSATHPWTKDGSGHFVAPREAGTSYTAISAGVGANSPLGLIVALRADGSVVMWDPSGLIPDAPAGVVFTQIAAGLGYWVGIDQAGQLHARSDSNHTAFTSVPAGVYSGVSAATLHATAIRDLFRC
jgi:alpha-tubulin suppressor-like RCC1 family protein